jgi:Domain of unknown function (DUF222)
MIREFDRAGGWQHQGALSCAHWLSWRIGLGLGPAREKVRVAHRLAELPLLDEAFRRGELSYSKVRAMTRVASASNEAELLDLARCSTAAQLERICRFCCQARRETGQDPRVIEDERRWVVSRPTEDGMVSIQIRLLPDEAARLMRAIELGAGRGSLADGAVAMAETLLAGSPGGTCRTRAVAPGRVLAAKTAVAAEGVADSPIDRATIGDDAVSEDSMADDSDEELVFFAPDGREIPPVPARPPLHNDPIDRLRAQIHEHGIRISAESNAPGWDGWPVDYDACVAAIGGWDEGRSPSAWIR